MFPGGSLHVTFSFCSWILKMVNAAAFKASLLQSMFTMLLVLREFLHNLSDEGKDEPSTMGTLCDPRCRRQAWVLLARCHWYALSGAPDFKVMVCLFKEPVKPHLASAMPPSSLPRSPLKQ